MNSYQFALIDKQHAYLGIGLQRIVRSWPALRRVPNYAIGTISYDQQLYFGVFKQLKRIPLTKLTDSTPFSLRLKGQSLQTYQKNFQRIQRHLQLGDLYQANYCYPFTAHTTVTPAQLLYRFTQQQPTSHGVYINTPELKLVSNSPELGVAIDGNTVICQPMKGTLQKAKAKSQLINSRKDQAELDMITDVVRNDLAQFAVPGSVRVVRRRQVVGLNTVWQAYSTITAQRNRKTTITDLLQALLPYASVTGAPKQRAVEILQQLETNNRGIYCGAIGYLQGNRRAEFNVAIRTAVLRNQQLTYWVGSGITLDSDAKAEYAETLAKAAILLQP
jgi:anthranilate/para-aminobenzoate synthase component I